MQYSNINSVHKYIINNFSVTPVFNLLLPFTLLVLISGCYHTFFNQFKDMLKDVYKRQTTDMSYLLTVKMETTDMSYLPTVKMETTDMSYLLTVKMVST